ncbi:MAG: hypothetical protein D6717_01950 [Gammaproteobacteria bacterium]|nr:MAG: hypothetical protein D6717_01950 [Gammaproteobacteria bacterium]
MPGSGCKAKEVFLEALSSAKADELKCDKRAVSAIKFVFKHGGTAKERKIGPYRIILVDTKDTHHLFVYDENGGMVKIDSDGLASDDLAEAIVIDKKDGHE